MDVNLNKAIVLRNINRLEKIEEFIVFSDEFVGKTNALKQIKTHINNILNGNFDEDSTYMQTYYTFNAKECQGEVTVKWRELLNIGTTI